MDAELQAALRWLGRGFHAGRFDTASVLRAIGIQKVYIVTGVYTGFFFTADDLRKSIKDFSCPYLSSGEYEKFEAWLANTKRDSKFLIELHEAGIWVPRPWEIVDGGGYLCIKEFDLDNPKILSCCANGPTTQIASFLQATCSSCGDEICVGHFLTCSVCDKDGCVNCCVLDDITIDRGTDIMCNDCAEEAGIFELMRDRDERAEAGDEPPAKQNALTVEANPHNMECKAAPSDHSD